jgi:hypothetical protein
VSSLYETQDTATHCSKDTSVFWRTLRNLLVFLGCFQMCCHQSLENGQGVSDDTGALFCPALSAVLLVFSEGETRRAELVGPEVCGLLHRQLQLPASNTFGRTCFSPEGGVNNMLHKPHFRPKSTLSTFVVGISTFVVGRSCKSTHE